MDFDDNVTANTTAGSETNGEDVTGSFGPDNSENNSGTDKPEETASNDTSLQNDGSNAGAEQNYLGTYKTREEAENGFKSAQAKITEQGNRIKELEAKINKTDAPQLPDINKEVESVQQKLNSEYAVRLQGLGVKYSSYLPDDIDIKSIEDIVANLPSQASANFMAEFKDIQAEYNSKIQSGINDVYKNAQAKYDEIKASDKERFKDNEVVFSAWYNPPKTIEELAELVANVKKQAIEDYVKEQAAKNEDEDHKKRLTNGGSGSKAKYGDGHIFTRQEIGKMSAAEFEKYERVISEQVAKGLVV